MGVAMALFAGATAVQAQTELVLDGSKGYDGVLVKGQDYVLPGTDASWYVMPDIFTHKSGDVWTFQAYGQAEYAYWFYADPDKKYVKVEYRQVDDDPESAFANWDINRAIYVNGSNSVYKHADGGNQRRQKCSLNLNILQPISIMTGQILKLQRKQL